MPPPIQVFDTPTALAGTLARRIADEIEAAGRYLLGCPGGRSAEQTYAALADEVARRRIDLSGLVVVMMDEYLGSDRGYVGADEPHSCRRFAREHILEPLAAAAPGGLGDDPLWMPDPREPGAYDRRIADAGGIDLFLLASGASDGHVAFNPPGTPRDSRTRIVPLAESTRRDNMVTFPSFGSLQEVPTHGVSVGTGTIAALSRSAVLLAHGTDKAITAARIARARGYDPQWPATIVTECQNPCLLLDAAAAAHV